MSAEIDGWLAAINAPTGIARVNTDDRYVVRTDHTAAQDIDGEVVVINFDTYHYYGLNRTGTAVWNLIAPGGRTVDEIAAAVATAFGVTPKLAMPHVMSLLTRLVDEGLAEKTAKTAESPAVLAPGGPYEVPSLEKHEKLDQLILSGE